jgi:hypothetical protein
LRLPVLSPAEQDPQDHGAAQNRRHVIDMQDLLGAGQTGGEVGGQCEERAHQGASGHQRLVIGGAEDRARQVWDGDVEKCKWGHRTQ